MPTNTPKSDDVNDGTTSGETSTNQPIINFDVGLSDITSAIPGQWFGTFVKNPVRSILGMVFFVLVSGLLVIQEALLTGMNAIIDAVVGLPPLVSDVLFVDSLAPIGSAVLELLRTAFDGVDNVLAELGLVALPGEIVVTVVIVVVTIETARVISFSVLDSIPVIGPLLTRILPGGNS